MGLGRGEVGMGLEAETSGVVDGAEYHLAGQFDRRFERVSVVSGEETAAKLA